MATSTFPLQSAIKKMLDNPDSRPKLSIKSPVTGGTIGGGDIFGEDSRYGIGESPDIALNNSGVIVEVHKSQKQDKLFYHVGRVVGTKLAWSESHSYDKGVDPSVAITDTGIVVEVHKSQEHDDLYYHIGRVNGEKIDWQDSHKYDKGITPSVAVNNGGVVVEVHETENTAAEQKDRLFYRIGKLSGNKIDWQDSHSYDDGERPSVAITDDDVIVEAHKSENYDKLYYRIGKVNGSKIEWGKHEGRESHDYDNGEYPSVAMTESGLVIEVHKSQAHDTLWTQTGQVNGQSITNLDKNVKAARKYGNGMRPRVACNSSIAVETHAKGNNELSSSVLTLSNSLPKPRDIGKLVAEINKMIRGGNTKVSRSDLNVGQQMMHLDLGGEGYHEVSGLISGFKTAINLNAKENDSQPPFEKIPNLVRVDYSKPYPFADGFADYITMQGAPLTKENIDEIVRMLRKGGKVGLWIAEDIFADDIRELASRLKSKAETVGKDRDEFGGKAGGDKILIEDGR